MTISPTALLSLPIITTGTESGTWGDVVDNGLTSYLDIAIAGGLSVVVTTADVTLTNTAGTSGATNISSTTAQYAILNVSGAMTGARSLILPSSSRKYIINNTCTGGFLLTVKGAATTGVVVTNNEKVLVAWNGTDYTKIGGAGASGGGGNPIMYENDYVVFVDYTMTTGKNASSTGPLTINAGITVTVPTGSNWVVL
jgi:hypothetical protein